MISMILLCIYTIFLHRKNIKMMCLFLGLTLCMLLSVFIVPAFYMFVFACIGSIFFYKRERKYNLISLFRRNVSFIMFMYDGVL